MSVSLYSDTFIAIYVQTKSYILFIYSIMTVYTHSMQKMLFVKWKRLT